MLQIAQRVWARASTRSAAVVKASHNRFTHAFVRSAESRLDCLFFCRLMSFAQPSPNCDEVLPMCAYRKRAWLHRDA